ncbi:RNA-binding protein 12 [Maniola hyperantus]|uniref:RNA-binding protein 12 n=1 Tax=Aphantopus hyperantus TaxID=2795564 RepID=UPI0015687F60|nr:RNA-binding protein 12-like [Maniola hyperantus]
MSVIIRLQNLPWSANALDIRNFFRGLSIPEGGVHIVGGELGDAFIAFSTDEDARQAMMLDGGKIKEIQVKLLLSSRSEMHKVIEAARQSVPILSLTAPAPAPAPAPVPTPAPAPAPVMPTAPAISPFSAALGNNPLSGFGIPGIGNPQEIPQPAVIEPPAPLVSPQSKSPVDDDKEEDVAERKRNKEKDRRRTRSRSRSRDRERKDRKRDRRDRSRSRDRRRRDRSRSRDRRKRDRKDRSRSRDRSPRRSRDKRIDSKSLQSSQERSLDTSGANAASAAPPPPVLAMNPNGPRMPIMPNHTIQNGPPGPMEQTQPRFNDPTLAEAFNKLQELGKKRNPNAFQGEQQNGSGFRGGRGGGGVSSRGGFRREGRPSRFDDQPRDCCVAIRNAPNHTSYGDVRRFFPFMIDKHGIKMINDAMGRRTGNIFVRFCDPRSRQLALQRKINELKGAHVTVEALDDDVYDAAVDSFMPYRDDNEDEDPSLVIADAEDPSMKPFKMLRIAELPNFIQEHDIIKAFTEFSLLSITLNDDRATRTKTALVQFVKSDDAKLAFKRKDNYLFGRRPAVFTPVTEEDLIREKQSLDQMEQPALIERPPKVQIPEPSMPRDPRQRRQQLDNGLALQSGVAMQAPGQAQFFQPAAPFAQNFGAPFPGAQFAGYPGPGNMEPRTAAANWANRMNFPKQPDAGLIPAPMQVPMQAAPAMNQQVITVDLDDEPLDCVLMKGLPRDATDRTIVNFLADTGAVPARIHLMLDMNGLPSGDCFCEFRSSQEARRAATKHGHTLDGCRVTVDLVMRSVVEEALEGPKSNEQSHEGMSGNGSQFTNTSRGGFAPRGQFRGRGGFERGGFDRGGYGRGGYDSGRGRGGRGSWNERGGRGFERGRGRGIARGRGGFGAESGRARDDDPDCALEDFGAPGCVVSMENVPFRASVEDILGFFGDFELSQDDVIRRYNERGQPTGDARVAFRTPFDAQRAVKTRNMDPIQDRLITLSIL